MHEFKIDLLPKVNEHLIYRGLHFDIMRKAPAAVKIPNLDKPVIYCCWELINDIFETSIMRENDRDIVELVESLLIDHSLFCLI